MKFKLYQKDKNVRYLFQKAEILRKYLKFVRACGWSKLSYTDTDNINAEYLFNGFDVPVASTIEMETAAAELLIAKRNSIKLLAYLKPATNANRMHNLCNYTYQPHSPNRRYKFNRMSFKFLYEGDRYRKGMNNYNMFPGLRRRI